MEVTYRFPVNVEFNWIVMRFFNSYLDRYASEDKAYLKKLVDSNKPFLIHEYIDMDMELVLNRLIDANKSELFRKQKVRALAMHSATFFFERLRSRRRELARNRIRQADYERSFKVREDLITDLGNPPTISQLAEKHGVSTSKLKTLFKQVFGKTIYQYYQEHRMEKARAMLAREDLNVSEVGYRVGYSNLSHFSEAFKKQYGRLPKQYMQETRTKKAPSNGTLMN
jgi:AraC-like DNA-binding protein